MIMNIIAWVIFGALAGWIASIIMSTNAEMGATMNIVVGILGAFIGGFIMRVLGGPDVSGFSMASLIVAILGAVLLLFFASYVHANTDKCSLKNQALTVLDLINEAQSRASLIIYASPSIIFFMQH